jgi:uncharacterized protein (DUF885 family)
MTEGIRGLADEYHEYRLRVEPTLAHLLGVYRYVDLVEDVSRAAEDADISARRTFAARAVAIDPCHLEGDDLITRETLIFDAETTAAVAEGRRAEFGVDPIMGIQATAPVDLALMSVPSAEIAEGMVAKFHAYGTHYDQLTDRLREGAARGRSPAEFAVTATLDQLDAILATPVDQDEMRQVQVPESFTGAQEAVWKERLAAVIGEVIRPAMERYRDVIRNEVAPHARCDENAGLWALPDGDVVFGRLIHHYTTLPMPAEEIHEIGLQQIARLADEHRRLGDEVLGTNDLGEIFTLLRDDPELHHETGPGVVVALEAAMAKARTAIGDWFGRLPSADCVVQETTWGTAGYYPPAVDGSRPGTIIVNTTGPTVWARYEMEAACFHEGIPGHHMQIAIAQERGDSIPAFRRNNYVAAYQEGWALYSERLADEMGLYSSQLDRIGMLAADSLRAARLVVETGMHAMRWSRQQGIDYLQDNVPLSVQALVAEVDRYLCFPGQSVALMIGRLGMEKNRAKAEKALGNRFDIRSFHDTILGTGPVPLTTLDRVVDDWIAAS